MPAVKFFLPLVLFLACSLAACNTVENRRSVYSPVKANGPYTRSLQEGTWKDTPKTVDVEYRETKTQKKKSRTVAPAPSVAPAVTAPLPE